MPTPIPQNRERLCRALAEYGIDEEKIPQTVARLTNPPLSFDISRRDPPGTDFAIQSFVGFDADMAAHMLRINDGKPDREITWKRLTRSERKRAERLWNSTLESDDLGVGPKGRPPKIDSALVLYCARVLYEANEKERFKFTRPMGGGAPSGPMWRALVEALPPEFKEHAETIAEIVVVTRSSKFEEWCRVFDLKPDSSDVADHPAMFRVAISLARRSRPLKRRI